MSLKNLALLTLLLTPNLMFARGVAASGLEEGQSDCDSHFGFWVYGRDWKIELGKKGYNQHFVYWKSRKYDPDKSRSHLEGFADFGSPPEVPVIISPRGEERPFACFDTTVRSLPEGTDALNVKKMERNPFTLNPGLRTDGDERDWLEFFCHRSEQIKVVQKAIECGPYSQFTESFKDYLANIPKASEFEDLEKHHRWAAAQRLKSVISATEGIVYQKEESVRVDISRRTRLDHQAHGVQRKPGQLHLVDLKPKQSPIFELIKQDNDEILKRYRNYALPRDVLTSEPRRLGEIAEKIHEVLRGKSVSHVEDILGLLTDETQKDFITLLFGQKGNCLARDPSCIGPLADVLLDPLQAEYLRSVTLLGKIQIGKRFETLSQNRMIRDMELGNGEIPAVVRALVELVEGKDPFKAMRDLEALKKEIFSPDLLKRVASLPSFREDLRRTMLKFVEMISGDGVASTGVPGQGVRAQLARKFATDMLRDIDFHLPLLSGDTRHVDFLPNDHQQAVVRLGRAYGYSSGGISPWTARALMEARDYVPVITDLHGQTLTPKQIEEVAQAIQAVRDGLTEKTEAPPDCTDGLCKLNPELMKALMGMQKKGPSSELIAHVAKQLPGVLSEMAQHAASFDATREHSGFYQRTVPQEKKLVFKTDIEEIGSAIASVVHLTVEDKKRLEKELSPASMRMLARLIRESRPESEHKLDETRPFRDRYMPSTEELSRIVLDPRGKDELIYNLAATTFMGTRDGSHEKILDFLERELEGGNIPGLDVKKFQELSDLEKAGKPVGPVLAELLSPLERAIDKPDSIAFKQKYLPLIVMADQILREWGMPDAVAFGGKQPGEIYQEHSLKEQLQQHAKRKEQQAVLAKPEHAIARDLVAQLHGDFLSKGRGTPLSTENALSDLAISQGHQSVRPLALSLKDNMPSGEFLDMLSRNRTADTTASAMIDAASHYSPGMHHVLLSPEYKWARRRAQILHEITENQKWPESVDLEIEFPELARQVPQCQPRVPKMPEPGKQPTKAELEAAAKRVADTKQCLKEHFFNEAALAALRRGDQEKAKKIIAHIVDPKKVLEHLQARVKIERAKMAKLAECRLLPFNLDQWLQVSPTYYAAEPGVLAEQLRSRSAWQEEADRGEWEKEMEVFNLSKQLSALKEAAKKATDARKLAEEQIADSEPITPRNKKTPGLKKDPKEDLEEAEPEPPKNARYTALAPAYLEEKKKELREKLIPAERAAINALAAFENDARTQGLMIADLFENFEGGKMQDRSAQAQKNINNAFNPALHPVEAKVLMEMAANFEQTGRLLDASGKEYQWKDLERLFDKVVPLPNPAPLSKQLASFKAACSNANPLRQMQCPLAVTPTDLAEVKTQKEALLAQLDKLVDETKTPAGTVDRQGEINLKLEGQLRKSLLRSTVAHFIQQLTVSTVAQVIDNRKSETASGVAGAVAQCIENDRKAKKNNPLHQEGASTQILESMDLMNWGRALAGSVAHQNIDLSPDPALPDKEFEEQVGSWLKKVGLDKMVEEWTSSVASKSNLMQASAAEARKFFIQKLLKPILVERRGKAVRARAIEQELKDIVSPSRIQNGKEQLWSWDEAHLYQVAPTTPPGMPPGTAWTPELLKKHGYKITQPHLEDLLREYQGLTIDHHIALHSDYRASLDGAGEFRRFLWSRVRGPTDPTNPSGTLLEHTVVFNRHTLLDVAGEDGPDGLQPHFRFRKLDEIEMANIRGRVDRVTKWLEDGGKFTKLIKDLAAFDQGWEATQQGLARHIGIIKTEAMSKQQELVEEMFADVDRTLNDLDNLGTHAVPIEQDGQTRMVPANTIAEAIRAKVSRHLTDQTRQMQALGKGLDAADFLGKVVIAYFGFKGAMGVGKAALSRFAPSNLLWYARTLRDVWWIDKAFAIGGEMYARGKMGLSFPLLAVPGTVAYSAHKTAEGMGAYEQYRTAFDKNNNGIPDWKEARDHSKGYSFGPVILEHLKKHDFEYQHAQGKQKQVIEARLNAKALQAAAAIDADGDGVPDWEDLDFGSARSVLRYATPRVFGGGLDAFFDRSKQSGISMGLNPLGTIAARFAVLKPLAWAFGKGLDRLGATGAAIVSRVVITSFDNSFGQTLTNYLVGGILNDRWGADAAMESIYNATFLLPFDDLLAAAIVRRYYGKVSPEALSRMVTFAKRLVNHGIYDPLQAVFELKRKGYYETKTGHRIEDVWEAIAENVGTSYFVSARASSAKSALMDSLPRIAEAELIYRGHSDLLDADLGNGKIRDIIARSANLGEYVQPKHQHALVELYRDRFHAEGLNYSDAEILAAVQRGLSQISFFQRRGAEASNFINSVVQNEKLKSLREGRIAFSRVTGDSFATPLMGEEYSRFGGQPEVGTLIRQPMTLTQRDQYLRDVAEAKAQGKPVPKPPETRVAGIVLKTRLHHRVTVLDAARGGSVSSPQMKMIVSAVARDYGIDANVFRAEVEHASHHSSVFLSLGDLARSYLKTQKKKNTA